VIAVQARVNTQGDSGVYMGAFDEIDDATLVLRAREGDERAFDALVGRYMRPAYAVALSVTRRHEDAEDAAQESFMVALGRLEECRNPAKFGGWFLTIVRNRARNLVRRESLRETESIPLGASAGGLTPDKVLEETELKRELQAALGELTETQREIVLLHDFEGWKHREIADKLGVPSGTVRSHLHFARKALREALSPLRESEEKGVVADGLL